MGDLRCWPTDTSRFVKAQLSSPLEDLYPSLVPS